MSELSSIAVADAPEVIPTQETPPPAVEETPAIPAPEAEAAAPAAEVEITADNLDELPEWKALSKPPEEAKPAAADDLPGMANEDIQARLEAVRVQRHNRRMQATDAGWRDLLVSELGLTPEEATRGWQKVLGPVLREMQEDQGLYYQALWKQAAQRALPEEAARTYMSRTYESPVEVAKTLYELGKKASHAEWEGKVAKGEYVPLAKVQVVRDAAFSRGRGLAEAQGGVSGSQSGASFGGSAGGTGGIRTKAQARALHVENKITSSQMRIINADPRIPEN